MYDFAMRTIKFRSDRLRQMMGKRRLEVGQLKYLTRVSQPMLSLLLSDERPNVSAVIVARLAEALGCSVDYLVGLTDDPSPSAQPLNDALQSLLLAARRLPHYRQIDLQRIAEMFAERAEQDDTQMMSLALDKIRALGGEQAELLILRLLDEIHGKDAGDAGTDAPGGGLPQ